MEKKGASLEADHILTHLTSHTVWGGGVGKTPARTSSKIGRL